MSYLAGNLIQGLILGWILPGCGTAPSTAASRGRHDHRKRAQCRTKSQWLCNRHNNESNKEVRSAVSMTQEIHIKDSRIWSGTKISFSNEQKFLECDETAGNPQQSISTKLNESFETFSKEKDTLVSTLKVYWEQHFTAISNSSNE